ncbi:MAG: phosphoenolpyruvate--protein phosphotransferase [Oligoflexia bacterium]|nr:phosphoenolpyruvate--protein phosphotransferase [Oligoflexia bacterium]
MNFSPKTARNTLASPLSGVIIPLESVPDPVFAQKLVGIGVSIDPTSQELLAPCDGKISQLHPAHHAVAITTAEGVEILIHIGLDTVKLRGEGFKALAPLGRDVRTGDPLIRFDADLIGRKAKSLLTEIVVANPDKIEGLSVAKQNGTLIQAGEPLLSFSICKPSESAEIKPTAMATTAKSDLIRVENPAGLHARPSAVLSNLAKQFESDLLVIKGYRTANLRSLVSVIGLEVIQGDSVQIQGIGPDARAAVDAIVAAIRGGFGEGTLPQPAPKAEAPQAAPPPIQAIREAGPLPERFTGVIASPGVTIGNVLQLKSSEIQVTEAGTAPHQEEARLATALREARIQLENLISKLEKTSDPKKALIFSAHQELLEDPTLLEIAHKEIAQNKSAPFAWKKAFTETAAKLASLNNQLLAARAGDVRDVGNRVLHLMQATDGAEVHYPPNSILVAEDLTPSDVATLDRDRVLGLITTTGGATSHVAILARSLDLPALAGVDPRVLEIPNGTPVLLDANHGFLRLHPSEKHLKALESTRGAREVRKKEELKSAHAPATTLDGKRIEIVANIKAEKEAQGALDLGAEGVGLLRTEFLFMNRESAPTEAEQLAAYSHISRLFGQHLGKKAPLIIRTLDVGGDKPLRYLPIPHEENPFLGERGIRVSLNSPDVFREQLRAILRTANTTDAEIRIMFPMISTLDELRKAKAILEEERAKLGVPAIQTGIMVEVPSAALLADSFAREADFFSIGSNDLTQYTLAIDRGHPKLAAQVDGLDPSILKLIDLSVRAAHKHGKWVGVCGGIASDQQAVPVLLGLGVDELSVSVPAIPAIKAQIRQLKLSDCESLAKRALEAESAQEIRSWIPLADADRGETFND